MIARVPASVNAVSSSAATATNRMKIRASPPHTTPTASAAATATMHLLRTRTIPTTS